MPRKVTKVFYVSDDGTEHDDREAARAHDRINRLEQVLHDAVLQYASSRRGRKPVAELRSAARDFAQIIVNDWQAVRDAMAAPDTPDEDENSPAEEDTPQARLQARRERVAAQDKTNASRCECDSAQGEPTYYSEATGCRHCAHCGGLVDARAKGGREIQDAVNEMRKDTADADFEATNDANEAPRPVNRVLDEERGHDGRCLYCGSKYIHALDCCNHPRNRKGS